MTVGGDERGQAALPPLLMGWFAIQRKVAVGEIHDRVGAVRDENHLHCAAPGRQCGVLGDPPGEDHPVERLHRDVAAAGGGPAKVDGERPAR